MDWVEAVVTVFKSLVWPVVVLLIVVILRKDLSELLGRVDEASGPFQLKAVFARQLRAASEIAEIAAPSSPTDVPLPPSELNVQPTRDFLHTEAIRHPTGAFILAWSLVEHAAKAFGYSPGQESLTAVVRKLADDRRVPSLTPSLAWQLEKLQDQVLRGDATPDPGHARTFVDAAWRLAATIRRAENPNSVWPGRDT